MSQSDHKLYLYDNNIDLVIGTDGLYVDNRPMNNRKLIAHKGLTNELIFSIRNRDRKLQNVFSDTLSAYLINPTTKRRLFYKLLEHTSNVGQVKLVLDEGDLRNVTAGLYRIYVAKQDVSGIDKPVYSDQNNGMVFDIQITEQIDQSPTPTQSANTFLQVSSTSDGDPANVFTTSAFSGNQNRNFPNALHSLAIYPDAYTGTLDVQASLVESVPSTNNLSTDWVTLESNIALSSSSTIVSRNYTINANWIRVLYTPTSGNISQVQVRN